ncbi:MAG: hypothetical protein ACYS29_00200 [Planctomycetota bacterium]|jgi:hypothetical protein
MKLAIIYDKRCRKLSGQCYSRTYLDMFEAVVARFEEVQHINGSCSAQDIEANVILIYDLHSSHHVNIDGLPQHRAVKYTYFNDPHQREIFGQYPDRKRIFKLDAKDRTQRALGRGVDFIICPYTNGYYEHIAPHLGRDAEDMLFWFPPAPSHKRFPLRLRPLSKRRHKILCNGMLNPANGPYVFRRWVAEQPETFYVEHGAHNKRVPTGADYGKLLCQFAAATALCEWYVVPKYLEIPLAGCVCFAQDQEDYRRMGFEDGKNCIFVNKDNFRKRTQGFLYAYSPVYYSHVAREGQKLISNKWTAECFADALYEHAKLKGARNERQCRSSIHTDVRTGADTAMCG